MRNAIVVPVVPWVFAAVTSVAGGELLTASVFVGRIRHCVVVVPDLPVSS